MISQIHGVLSNTLKACGTETECIPKM
jgi:hypothetical protein